jgi:hypothetical protein
VVSEAEPILPGADWELEIRKAVREEMGFV